MSMYKTVKGQKIYKNALHDNEHKNAKVLKEAMQKNHVNMRDLSDVCGMSASSIGKMIQNHGEDISDDDLEWFLWKIEEFVGYRAI